MEAFKRAQQLASKPGVTQLPFARFLQLLQDAYHVPVVGAVLGGVLARVAGLRTEFLARLNSEAELEEAAGKSFQQLAEELLAVKYDGGRAGDPPAPRA
jgi:hypothetical protein